jgi:Putative zinc-finger
MTHAEVEEGLVADRYLLGQLTEDEVSRFEEHYLSCAECLDRLAATEELAGALKQVVAADVARVTAVRQLAVVGWLARLGRSHQAALLLSALFLALVLPTLTFYRSGHLERRLGETRSALAAAARQRAEGEASRRDLARAQRERAALVRELAQAREPQADVPTLFLGAERGTGGEPTYRLRLPRRPGTVVLALPLEPSAMPAWQVVLARRGGPEIWRSAPLVIHQDTLTVAIPSNLLEPGDHVLTLEGMPPAGRGIPVARFTFRVLPPLAG